jgi:hypothetical protein
MTTPADAIWRAAHFLVRDYGHAGALIAATHADQCLAEGNLGAHVMWKRIAFAIVEITREKPRDGEGLN